MSVGGDGGDDVPETARALAQAAKEHEATKGYRARRAVLDSDTDPDTDAEPYGAGVRGFGPPLQVGSHDRRRDLCDGAGLCSLGIWAPWQRPPVSHPALLRVRALLLEYIAGMKDRVNISAAELFDKLAAGEVLEDPFAGDEVGLRRLVDQVLFALSTPGASAFAQASDLAQPVRIRALQRILQLGGDPDWRGMEHFCRGVRLGVSHRLPRTPAVYSRKRRWRLEGQSNPDFDVEAERQSLGGTWRDNYEAAIVHDAAILQQLEDAVQRGMAIRLTEEEASFHFPALTVNSLNAVAKVDEAGAVTSVRLVLDGTHGVVVNRAIRQRDQDRCPVASDVRRVQRAQAMTGPALGLALDVREAHRLPRVHPLDWPYQGCRSSLSSDVFIFTVGCFGISTAAYWWSRMGGALVRAAHLLSLPTDQLWLLLMADDLKCESTAERPHVPIIFVVLLLVVLGVPLSWHKAQGGRTIRWIGYEVHLGELALGITQRRADWCVDFLLQLARDGRADVARMRSGLGRLCFVVGALEWERPFLAPLYAFLARQPRWGHRQLPTFVRVISHYIAARLSLRRLYPSATARSRSLEAFRIDASAEGDSIGVGGWLPTRNQHGVLDRAKSPWFSFSLNRTTAPWAYVRGQPFRTIAALEAVGVLIALVVFEMFLSRDQDVVYAMPALTDNKGNQFSLSRLQTARFPLCAVVMEIAARSERLRIRLEVDWIPRELNTSADALAAGNHDGFSEDLRQKVDWANQEWLVLDWALGLGTNFYSSSATRVAAPPPSASNRRKKKISFRESDPWSWIRSPLLTPASSSKKKKREEDVLWFRGQRFNVSVSQKKNNNNNNVKAHSLYSQAWLSCILGHGMRFRVVDL